MPSRATRSNRVSRPRFSRLGMTLETGWPIAFFARTPLIDSSQESHVSITRSLLVVKIAVWAGALDMTCYRLPLTARLRGADGAGASISFVAFRISVRARSLAPLTSSSEARIAEEELECWRLDLLIKAICLDTCSAALVISWTAFDCS